jgi:bacillopeptidase F (M6 metalloprotease family)
MKNGEEYELFVFEKFKSLFKQFDVTYNDKIEGKESKLQRQIDISIRGKIGDTDLLYLVQCKDHSRPADITKIGEFASVIKDTRASKGFIVCASGFVKSIHHYARTLGIELLSVEDINSPKWKAEIEIPVIYIKTVVLFDVFFNVVANQTLVDKNREPISISQNDIRELSTDGAKTVIDFAKYITKQITDNKIDVFACDGVQIKDANLLIKFSDIWVSMPELTIKFQKNKSYYLKYLTPSEYSQVVDHLNETFLPLDKGQVPVTTGFCFEIEDRPTSFENPQLAGFGIEGVIPAKS